MADQSMSTSGIRRSAVYSYLRPAIDGKRVLEVGCGTGEAAAHLIRLGARSVIAAGSAQEIASAKDRFREGALGFTLLSSGALGAAGPFDLVLVPEAGDILRGRGAIQLAGVLSLLAPGGQLACVVPNGDCGEGVSYYEVVDALTPHFSKVRMFGQTRFAAYGIAEFDEAAADLRLDASLIDQESEDPSHYIALAGPDAPHGLGYALVQIPSNDPAASEPTAWLAGKSPDGAVAELRQKLGESEGKADGLLRVSRAQSEEIEELRARLRRTAEARADLDEEVRRLRKALIEADESVVNLTRKTTEEMTALAQRLTSGLRGGEGTPSPALAEELRRREEELAARESALSERDDRIAALEVAKQEATWRADAAEDEVSHLRAELSSAGGEYGSASGPAEQQDELAATRKAQGETIEEFRRAAAVHLDEVSRLRDAANEQASLVTELEEALHESESRLSSATAEVARLQKALTEVEDADRARRSRLAELEGLMLRAGRASAQEGEHKQQQLDENQALRARLAERDREVDQLRGRLDEAEAVLAAARAQHATDLERLAVLEQQVDEHNERDRRLAELRAEAPDPEEVYERLFDIETQYLAATMAAARVPELEAKVAELVARLAGAERA